MLLGRLGSYEPSVREQLLQSLSTFFRATDPDATPLLAAATWWDSSGRDLSNRRWLCAECDPLARRSLLQLGRATVAKVSTPLYCKVQKKDLLALSTRGSPLVIWVEVQKVLSYAVYSAALPVEGPALGFSDPSGPFLDEVRLMNDSEFLPLEHLARLEAAPPKHRVLCWRITLLGSNCSLPSPGTELSNLIENLLRRTAPPLPPNLSVSGFDPRSASALPWLWGRS